MILLFLPHFLEAPKSEGCCFQGERLLYGRDPSLFGEEPGKQKTRSCRTQEFARSSAQENERRKKVTVTHSVAILAIAERRTSECEAEKGRTSTVQSVNGYDAISSQNSQPIGTNRLFDATSSVVVEWRKHKCKERREE
ncbi:MAG TPA: hypothetical protein VHW24_27460 [Bryobacteraceae bacterium]|nr:hypothetical protein [Bryobacteraceae bacterium]